MRAAVNLDPEVNAALRNLMRERGVSLSQALNDAVRREIAGTKEPWRRRYRQKTYQMGLPRKFRWDEALALVDASIPE